MSELDRLPVIIGAGQDGRPVPDDLDTAFGGADLAGRALERAFEDAGVAERTVDLCYAIRTFGDSGPAFPNPFGGPDNLGAAAFSRAGGTAARHIYSHVGGQQPQTLLAEAARAILAGEVETVAILGAEAIANVKAARRAGATPDWTEATGVALEDRGAYAPGGFMVHNQAIAHRIAAPVYYYALMESARRAALGEGREAYAARMGKLWAHFAAVAADNPYATERSAPSSADIVTPGPANPMISSPYTRAMVARDGVNQGAAVLVTSYGRAKAMGVRDVTFLHSHDSASECHPLLRARIDRAPAQAAVLRSVGGERQASAYDLYSCFPIVPLEAMHILDLAIGERPLTLTGGLPFFGGPGNTYTLHAIAEAHARVRGTAETALVYANGGLASKHAAGLYGGEPPERLAFHNSPDTDPAHAPTTDSDPSGRVIAATVEYRGGEPTGVLVMGETDAGHRFYARGAADLAPEVGEGEPVGMRLQTKTAKDQQNVITALNL